MTRWQRTVRMAPTMAVFLLAVAIGTAASFLLQPPAASAQAEDPDALKAYWQTRYRDLRHEEARLVQTVKLATKEYADANRRTYRRSGVRHFHRTNANEAKKELADVRSRIESIYEEVVAAGGSMNWIYEVDDEGIDADDVQALGVYEDDGMFGGKGAYAPSKDDEARDADRDESEDDGRNPLYQREDTDDEPASFEDEGLSDYDYDAWREDRSDYEGNRAPEEPLGSDEN